jgi:mannose-6-phosphate isomerase
MGTHINGPSELTNGENLSNYLSKTHNIKDLPYLLKVLSIKDPLSIQIHPDKHFAEILHTKDKNNYKDPNHKPELSIAVSQKFSLIYGFKALNKAIELIEKLKTNNSELNKLIKDLIQDKSNNSLYKNFLLQLVELTPEEVEYTIKSVDVENPEIQNLIKLLLDKFGYDRGILFAIFMNYFEMTQGDAIFIPPNMPHAYIEGNCIECMANSDNVIRIGLTPKFVDKNNFKYILDNHFEDMIVSEYNPIGFKISENIIDYSNPNFKDFKLTKIDLQQEELKYNFENHSILFCFEGCINLDSDKINRFESYLIESGNEFTLTGKGTIYIATYNN